MNKRTLNRIIIFMGVALAILIALQSWWIVGSYSIYEQQINKELDAALFSSLNKIEEIRIKEFKDKFGNLIDLNNIDEQAIKNIMNMTISNMYPKGSHLDLNKLKDICANELRSRKIRSSFQFEIEDLFRGTKSTFPKIANYIPQTDQYNIMLEALDTRGYC